MVPEKRDMNEEKRGRSAQKDGRDRQKKAPVMNLRKKLLQGRKPVRSGGQAAQRPRAAAEPAASKGRLRVSFLGGVEEIGKNMTVLEYADDIVIIDCGSIFPKEDMLGIDLVIPDVTYLQRNRDKIRGILVTHGH